MDLSLYLTTLLLLMLQALNGVQLQDSIDNPTLEPNYSNGSPSPSVGPNTSDVNTNTTNENMTAQAVSTLNSISPGGEVNGTDSLPASTLPPNATAGSSPSPDILLSTTNVSLQSVTSGNISTRPRDTDLPELSDATVSSPLNHTTNSWASHGTSAGPNATLTAAPNSPDNGSSTTEHIPGLPQDNSTSTTTITSYNSTTNSTGLSTKVIAGFSGNDADDKGFAATNTNARNTTNAWAAILGTALAVGFVGFIIYTLLKKKNGRQFMHRKLIEDMPSEPVLRLDNSEPLDLKFDGLAYYNPGLQGDHIQMTNFPQGHMH